MAAEDWHVDPELEQILREVARDPRATLLRIARPKAIRAVYESSILARESATGLLASERQLLRVHREELARLLRRACVMLIFESPEGRQNTMRQVTATYRHDPPTRERWLDDARLELSVSTPDAGVDVLTLLERCVGDVASGRATIGQLAAASSRLQPTAQADIYQGEECAFDQRPCDAGRIYRAVLEKWRASSSRALAWTNLGRAEQSQGNMDSAWQCHATAVESDDSLLLPWLNRLIFAWESGHSARLNTAAREVDERFGEDQSGVDEFIAVHVQRGTRECSTATTSGRSRAELDGGTVSRRIVRALEA